MIDVYCASASTPIGNIWLSGCGILLVYDDAQHQRYRLLGFGLDTATPQFAIIQTVRLALAAINPIFRRTTTVVHLPNDNLLVQLANPTENQTELLRWHDLYSDVGFLVEPTHKFIEICYTLAQRMSDNQTTFDSSTTDGVPDG
jgi:hypothetical protein